jgi:hypothetical protein
MFISRSGTSHDRPTAEFATSRAELCLAAIKRFYRPTALVSPIIEDMDRMIKTFSPNSPSNMPSQEFDTDRRDPALRLSGPARARQGLEIHSLLRRSGFLDDSYDDSTSPGSTDSASLARRQMISQQISALSSKTLTNGQTHATSQQFQDSMIHQASGKFPERPKAMPAAVQQELPTGHTMHLASTAFSGALYPWVERQEWNTGFQS